jgi:hypothetical protein
LLRYTSSQRESLSAFCRNVQRTATSSSLSSKGVLARSRLISLRQSDTKVTAKA